MLIILHGRVNILTMHVQRCLFCKVMEVMNMLQVRQINLMQKILMGHGILLMIPIIGIIDGMINILLSVMGRMNGLKEKVVMLSGIRYSVYVQFIFQIHR